MKEIICKLLLISISVFFMNFTGCSKKEQIAPIDDGSFLKYKVSISGPMGKVENYLRISFEKVDEEHFKVTITPIEKNKNLRIKAERSDLIVDKSLKTENGENLGANFITGQFWIPPHKRKIGAKIMEGKIREIKNWKKREVYILNQSLGLGAATLKWYYDKTTGFLAGNDISSMGAGANCILIDTNIDGL